MSRRFLGFALIVLMFVALGMPAFGQGAGAKFGPGAEPDTLAPTASLWGGIGLWKVLSAETPPAHSFGTSGWIDRINRNPGGLTITGTGTSVFYGLTDRIELGVRINVNERILSRREDQLGLGQATLNVLHYSACPGCPLLQGPVQMPGVVIPQLRNPFNNQLTGRTGYYPLYPYVNRRLQTGFGDIVVSGKVNVASEKRGSNVSFAFRPWISIPTHRDTQALLNVGSQTGHPSGGIDALLSKNVGDAGVYFNAGYQYLPEVKHAGATLVGATHMIPVRAGMNVPRTSKLQLVVELTSENFLNQGTPNTVQGSPNAVDATGGFRWYIKNWLGVSGGYRRTLNQFGGDKNGFVFTLNTSNMPVKAAPPLPVPPTVTCSAEPARTMAGTTVRLLASGSTTTGRTLTYMWSSPQGRIDGSGPEVRFDTTGLRAGDYNAMVRVSDGADGFADCTTTVTIVAPPAPKAPTASCSVDRSSVNRGESVTFTVTGNSGDNRPLNYQWSGAVRGTSRTTRLDTTSLSAGTYTATARVTDDRGLSAECSASTSVSVPAPPMVPESRLLNTCTFTGKSNKLKPARVDNACKAILDDVALRLQSDADATAILVGNADPSEMKMPKGKKKAAPADLGAQRAANVKDYLVSEKGLSANRMQVRSASGGPAEVQIHLVPRGATYNGAGSMVTEPMAQPRNPMKKKMPAKKKMEPAEKKTTEKQ
jgi:outer membrane protein OmpA-like peptidoglycan-associated protein